ncbi:MAG TPA: beta-L-arabinofuranosidase domain-containing protein, partial [Chthoniobacterales bacterium]|nr:beta-L-arabinofuranosidase domain-containing protein [Chthoniobacterales bacterium]
IIIHGGFWKKWRDLIGSVTLFHQLEEMRGEGHVDALQLDQRMHRGRAVGDDWYWGGSIFWDSDLAKWLEAASAYLEQTKDDRLEKAMDDIIARFERAQTPDGYVNSHILTWRPRHRFKNLRDLHELYCAGHLIEAAVVHYEATGKQSLLNVARRFADLLVKRFGPDQIPGYCGHPEIELALVRLYRLTHDPSYLRLSQFFIDRRGQDPNFFDLEATARLDAKPFRPSHPGSPYAYMQAHQPIREQSKVVGHAVRAMYLFSAVVDVGLETADPTLIQAAERIWRDVIDTKLYITGGIGSASENEGFTRDYDLPNERAYAETCASIGLFLFAHRLLQSRLSSEFSDVMELALYNCILSGIGLDGKTFFYDNPLASHGQHQRIPWPWWCPCCPPNLARLLSSLSGYLISERAESIAIHQYVTCRATLRDLRLEIESGLPFSGENRITVTVDQPREKTFALRRPGWAGQTSISVNGTGVEPEISDGYFLLRRTWQTGDQIDLHIELPIRKKFARFEVDANRGRMALMRGPLVYCLEQIDNGPELDRLTIPVEEQFRPVDAKELLNGIVTLHGRALRETPAESGGLYTDEPARTEAVGVIAIPYYAWANRGVGEMQIWTRSR